MLRLWARLEFTENSKVSILLHILERFCGFFLKSFYWWNIKLSLFLNSNHLITDIVKQNSIHILSHKYNWLPFLRPMYLFLLVLSVLLMYFHESKSHVSSWFCNRRRYKIFKPLKSDWKKKEIRFLGWSRGSMIWRTTGSLRKNAQSLHTLHLFVKRHQQTLLLHKIAIFRYIFLSADSWSGPELSLETFKWSTWLYEWLILIRHKVHPFHRENQMLQRDASPKAGMPENGRTPRAFSWTGMTGHCLQFSTCYAWVSQLKPVPISKASYKEIENIYRSMRFNTH